MMSSARRIWIPAVVMAWLLAAGSASAALTPEVKDDAGIFKKETIKQANQEIKQLKDLYKEDLLIETYKEIPADRKGEYSKEQKNEFFQKWAIRGVEMRVAARADIVNTYPQANVTPSE